MHIRVFFIGQLSYGYDAQLILVCINDIALARVYAVSAATYFLLI